MLAWQLRSAVTNRQDAKNAKENPIQPEMADDSENSLPTKNNLGGLGFLAVSEFTA